MPYRTDRAKEAYKMFSMVFFSLICFKVKTKIKIISFPV